MLFILVAALATGLELYGTAVFFAGLAFYMMAGQITDAIRDGHGSLRR
jgi:hypothetical protein